MNESLAILTKQIKNSSDATTLKKSLYLSADSYFLWLYDIILDPIKNYLEDFDYSYLSKTFNYLKYTYIKLLSKGKYTKELVDLKEYYVELVERISQSEKTLDANMKTFSYIINGLNILLKDKQNSEAEMLEDKALYHFFLKSLFENCKLEYVSKAIMAKPELLNSEVDEEPLFCKVIREYLNAIKDNDETKRAFYLRVINKF